MKKRMGLKGPLNTIRRPRIAYVSSFFNAPKPELLPKVRTRQIALNQPKVDK